MTSEITAALDVQVSPSPLPHLTQVNRTSCTSLIYYFYLFLGRYLSTTISEPAQVVPDIDEDSTGNKGAFENSSRQRPPELELRLTKLRDTVTTKEPRVTLTRESLLQPPIRRISEDARPLTAAEILAHRHLL